jgi:hypothetical protein
MGLALICGSAIGAYAHAVGHCHHGHAHAVHQEDVEASTPTGAQHQGESQKVPAAVDHTQCCDTICHGGYAIVDMNAVVPLPPTSTHAIPSVRLAVGTQPHSLERPPRSLVLA